MEKGQLFDLRAWRRESNGDPDASFRAQLESFRSELYECLPHLPLDDLRDSVAYHERTLTLVLKQNPELSAISHGEPVRPEEQELALYEVALPLLRQEIERRGTKSERAGESFSRTRGEDLMPSVYLSHSNIDKDFAQRLADDLKRASVDVWFENFKPSFPILRSMRQGVEDIEYFEFLLSPNSVQPSCLALKELEWALEKQAERRTVGKVLPLLLKDCDLPDSLKDLLYIDFRDPMHYHERLNSLLEALGVEQPNGAPGPEAEARTGRAAENSCFGRSLRVGLRGQGSR